MKQIINTLAAICLAVLASFQMRGGDMSNSIEYDHLYIVGDATVTSWDLGTAEEFLNIDNGVFEWTGKLLADKEFKFMNNLDGWNKHIVATMSDQYVDFDGVYSLNFYADWALDGSKDCKFKVAETGNYTITVDLPAMRMAVSRPVQQPAWPDKFYVAGSAVSQLHGYDLEDAHSVEFKGVIPLSKGSFKLMDTSVESDATTYYIPRFPEVDIAFGAGFNSKLQATDDRAAMGWTVGVAGDYAFYFDKSLQTYAVKKYVPRKILYIVGGCCEHAWNYWDDKVCCMYPDPDDPDVMVWEGELRIGFDGTNPEEPDKFKILTAQDWFRETYHPYDADACVLGSSDARISGGDDLKWTIDRDGVYRIELNTRTEVLTGIYLGSDDPKSDSPETAGLDAVLLDGSACDQDVVYYNLQGMQVTDPAGGLYLKRCGNDVTKVVIR